MSEEEKRKHGARLREAFAIDANQIFIQRNVISKPRSVLWRRDPRETVPNREPWASSGKVVV